MIKERIEGLVEKHKAEISNERDEFMCSLLSMKIEAYEEVLEIIDETIDALNNVTSTIAVNTEDL